MTELEKLASRAKKASRQLACCTEQQKNAALRAIAAALLAESGAILRANQTDMENAVKNGTKPSMLDRLKLTEERIAGIADGVLQVAELEDPTGRIIERTERPNGLVIEKVTVPLGVIGIIYEARPNVTADAAVLCLKAGSAAVLRGGSEAVNTSRAIADIMRAAIASEGLPEDAVCFVDDTSRDSARGMMELKGYLDVLIPRGGAGLIRTVVENAKVPVIETGVGICHIYVEKTADLAMAAEIIKNAKCSRPSVCNAAECLLVDEAAAADFLPLAASKLDEYNVEIRACEKAAAILGERAKPACETDFDTEFLDYVLAVKVVSGVDEAIDFINEHGTRHSEAIVTRDEEAASRFLNEVDAAAVYVNASTRFTDGGEFGLGAELGISTQKLHARGPMGLRQLTSTKYLVRGNGQIR